MVKPLPWLLLAALFGAALSGCGKPAAEADAAPSRGLKVEAYEPPIAKAPLGHKLETIAPHAEAAPASRAPAVSDIPAQAAAEGPAVRAPVERLSGRAPAAPPVVEPHHDLYDDRPAPPPSAPEPSGFRLTVPLCRRAEAQNDPLAQTAECAQLIEAARAQAEACREAFEDGDDRYVLSPACRQAAGFR